MTDPTRGRLPSQDQVGDHWEPLEPPPAPGTAASPDRRPKMTEPPNEPQEPTEGAPEPPEANGDADPGNGNGEAARYRRRLREAESERDRLRERLTRLHTEQA